MKRILLLSFAFLTLISFSVMAQRSVSGKVTDDTGESLPGVNVVIKGTTTGVTTDLDGNYVLSVDDGATLIFSYVGFETQEIQVGARTTIDVTLGGATELQEVVVTGYQNQLKREVTGSIASVKAEEIENLPMQSFDRAIQGRVAGTQIAAASGQPGGALNIRIRGIGSINSGNDPLIIIDGVQVASVGGSTQANSNPLASINPNDIESIDILKDASAAAIYGAQAANGVIVVTTKGGKAGQKSQVNINYQEGIVQAFNLYDVLDGAGYARVKAEQEINSGQDPARAGGAYEVFGNPDNPGSVENFDWVDAMFQDASFRTLDVSLSGGDEKTTFFFGSSYNFQEGQIIKSNFERYTGRLNITHRPTDKLTVNAKIGVTHVEQFGSIANGNFVNGPFVATFASMPTVSPYDADGNFVDYPTNGLSHLFGYNILQGVNEEIRLGRTFQTVSSASATYQILPELSISGLVGVDMSMNKDINERPSTLSVFRANGGSVFHRNRRSLNWNSNVNLNFNKTFGDVHNVKAIVGYEYKAERREASDLGANGFANSFFRNPADGQPQSVGGFFQEYKRLGYFGKADYSYDDRYLASVTVRRDGHSRFGTKNQYGTFYAGSLGWRLSQESFMSGLDFFNDLKLRASYGVLGNAEIGNYLTQTTYGASSGQYAGASPLTITLLGNDEITWEEEESYNVGLDFSVLENRIFGSVDFWRTNNNELLFNVPFLRTGGINNSTVTANVGSVQNQGIDLEIGGIVVDKSDFRYEMRFNISFLQNEVTELIGQDTIFNGNIPSLIVGQPVDFFYLLDYAGVNPANGRGMVRGADGSLTYNPGFGDGAVRGSSIPTSFGGWTNTFSYKGLTLDVFFQFQLGAEAFNGDLYNLLGTGGNDNRRTDILNRWQQPGDVTNIPQLTNNGTIEGVDQQFGFIGTTQYMSDASYVRLKAVTLSYNLPQSVMNTIGMRSLNVYLQGINMLTWTKFDGIDPEVITNNNTTGASSFGTYPLGRQFSAGIQIGL